MTRLLALLAATAVLTTGCLGPAPADGPAADGDGDGALPPGTDDHPGTGPTNDAPFGPVAHAPSWSPGTWWTWEVTGRSFGTYELTTVVARDAADGATAAVGYTDVEPGLRSHVFHVPPVGEVRTEDHAWTVHDAPARLVDFPLHDGKTWTGTFEDREVAFEAAAVERDGRTVFAVNGTYVAFDGQGPRYVYDPALGTFSELHIHYGGGTPFSSARVVAHGADHRGVVHIPEPRDKFLGGAGFPGVPDPVRSFAADEGKHWLVFGCYLGGTAGRYEITYVPPSTGEDPLTCSFGHQGTEFANDVQVLWRASVPGDWTVRFGVVGAGYAEAEVVGVWDEVCRVGTVDDDGSTGRVPACA